MHFASETTSDGVSERLFTLNDIPGVLWSAIGATGGRPLVLLGFCGVSMGSAIGVRLAAVESRITAAVFDLAGDAALAETAAPVTVPVEFRPRWDGEFVPREAALALFDAFASREKTRKKDRPPTGWCTTCSGRTRWCGVASQASNTGSSRCRTGNGSGSWPDAAWSCKT